MTVQITAGINAVTIQQIARRRDKIATRVAVLDLRRGRRQIGRDERAAQQRLQQIFHRRVSLDHVQRVNDLAPLQCSGRRPLSPGAMSRQTRADFHPVAGWPAPRRSRGRLCSRSSRPEFACADSGCSVNTNCRLWPSAFSIADDELVRHANSVRQRTDDRPRLAQRRNRARVEALVRSLQVVPARSGANVSPPAAAKIRPARREDCCNSLLQFAQPLLPLLHRAARALRRSIFPPRRSR